MFTDFRSPVVMTTGVWPTGAHVVPAWWSVRMLASSAKKMLAPSSAASLRIFGYADFFHSATRSGSC